MGYLVVLYPIKYNQNYLGYTTNYDNEIKLPECKNENVEEFFTP